MRDVEALCKRVLVITQGRLVYDGPLTGITDQFGQEKIVRLEFDGHDSPTDLERFGTVARREGPMAELRVERARVSEVLAALLAKYTLLDFSVQDLPLDQVIARVFEAGKKEEVAV